MKSQNVQLEDLYRLELKTWWTYFKGENFAFKMICLYLFTEYVRPQSILPWLDFLPWAQLFIMGALLGLLADPKRQWVKSPINKWMVLFFCSTLWSTYHAHYPDWSYRSLANFYTWFIIYFLIINIVTTPQRLLFFLAIFCLASFKLSFSLALSWAMRGFSFTSWGLMGPPGFFQNSGELAIQMAVFWPIGLAVALSLKPYLPRWKQFILILMPITAVMVILGASSRGGQLALVSQAGIRFSKNIFRLRSFFAIALVAWIAWSLLPPEQKARFTDVGKDKTSQQRMLYWENGFEMMTDHPLNGVGFYNFIPYFEDYYSEDMLYENAQLAHNIFIQVGSELGVVGLTIYVFILFSIALVAVNSRKAEKSTVVDAICSSSIFVSIFGFVVAGLFVSVVYYPYLWVGAALVSSYNHLITSKEPAVYGKDKVKRL